MITRQIVRNQILAYLNQDLPLAQLVDWAEDSVVDGELEEKDSELLMEVLAQLGAADAERFSLSWEDYYRMLSQLGYRPQVVTA